jgi:hypothetical protein
MELRQIEKNDYSLILELDAKVYPVSEENKINSKIIDKWYNTYPKYGMIYTNQNKIVAMAIIIPMPFLTWEKLIKGECFENTLDIKWEKEIKDKKDKTEFINIGVHVYHIEDLDRNFVGKNFYKRMLEDLKPISMNYHHQINGLSGYCVTPKGNRLFQEVLKCKNAYDIIEDKNKKNISEFIVQDMNTTQIKIVECPVNTDINQLYYEQNNTQKKCYKFISKCNMLYTIRKEPNNSPVWIYL